MAGQNLERTPIYMSLVESGGHGHGLEFLVCRALIGFSGEVTGGSIATGTAFLATVDCQIARVLLALVSRTFARA